MEYSDSGITLPSIFSSVISPLRISTSISSFPLLRRKRLTSSLFSLPGMVSAGTSCQSVNTAAGKSGSFSGRASSATAVFLVLKANNIVVTSRMAIALMRPIRSVLLDEGFSILRIRFNSR
ncbi:MAG: hypothetical protein D6816_14365 [Bacteroidetes bacterium]|nr:MAG: hypothetical protein D6816_14365 [Bacteroidota bacterium]